MTMPLQFSKRLTLFTGALLSGTLVASLACATTSRSTTSESAPNTDATVMGQATPTGDDVSRAPASDSTANEEQVTIYEETYRAPASTGTDQDMNRKKQTKKKKTKTESTTTETTSPGGAADTAVPEGGATNRDLSQAGPPDTSFSGTSYGKNGDAQSATETAHQSDESTAGSSVGTSAGDLSTDRSPASVNGLDEGDANVHSSDQITTDKEQMRKSSRKQNKSDGQYHQHPDQSYQQNSRQPQAMESRGPADGRTIVVVQDGGEPELSSRLNALGAPRVQINDENNPAWKGNDAFDTEPYSRFPYQVGSTQVTGKDKSVAVLEGTNRFTDPNALARNEATRDATVKLQDLDFAKYGYNKRGDFQSTMMSRLNNVDRKLDNLDAKALENYSMPRAELEQVITDLQARQDAAKVTVDYADTISSDRWESYKNSFRQELMQLEGSVAQLASAMP